jgi:hypothetical protein
MAAGVDCVVGETVAVRGGADEVGVPVPGWQAARIRIVNK